MLKVMNKSLKAGKIMKELNYKDIDKELECEYIHIHEDIVKEVIEDLPEEEELCDLADFFKIFADTTRIKILYVLSKHEMCVCDISQLLKTSQSAI